MSEAGKPVKPQRDPFLEPLDPAQVREFFRRLEARPQAEQQAFVARVNWNLVDPTTESRLMAWLATNVASGDPSREDFALALLDKMPHFRRGRYAAQFQALLPRLRESVATRLANAFGPVLGGEPKRSTKPGAAKPGAAKPAPIAPNREANADDLSKLKDFFGKFGGAR